MNSLDDLPCAASIANSHTDGWWKLVLVGEAKEAHTCLHLLWTHMDTEICTHVHTGRPRERMSLPLCVCAGVCLLTSAGAHCSLDRGWSSYSWHYGAYTVDEEIHSVGFSLPLGSVPLVSSACAARAHTASNQADASLSHDWLMPYSVCLWQLANLRIAKAGRILFQLMGIRNKMLLLYMSGGQIIRQVSIQWENEPSETINSIQGGCAFYCT